MKPTLTRLFSTVFLFALLAAALTGCGSKTAQTAAGFTQIMEDAGFEVEDITAEMEAEGFASSALIAIGENYQIEYYTFADSEVCSDVFYDTMDAFDAQFSVKTMSSKITVNNYKYYAFNADGDFHMIARIDNTMLYCVADKAYKNEIVELIKTLGYK